MTAGPGDAVWEHYGHNALRVLDTRTGRDYSYDWGIFDFRQADFMARFLQGRMLYMVARQRTDVVLDFYRETDREVVLQELDLTPAEKAMLRDAANRNALPRNRDFTYQYFLDNCSTRIRDLLDRVLGGALSRAFEGQATGLSYRHHARRLTQVDPLVYTGADLALGSPADRPISAWEELFLPLALRDRIRGVRITRDGETRPLVRGEEVLYSSTRPAEPAEPPAWLGRYLTLGLVLGALFAAAGAPGSGPRRSCAAASSPSRPGGRSRPAGPGRSSPCCWPRTTSSRGGTRTSSSSIPCRWASPSCCPSPPGARPGGDAPAPSPPPSRPWGSPASSGNSRRPRPSPTRCSSPSPCRPTSASRGASARAGRPPARTGPAAARDPTAG